MELFSNGKAIDTSWCVKNLTRFVWEHYEFIAFGKVLLLVAQQKYAALIIAMKRPITLHLRQYSETSLNWTQRNNLSLE